VYVATNGNKLTTYSVENFSCVKNIAVDQGWGICGMWAKCGPREHLIWSASEFSLSKLIKTQHRVKTELRDRKTCKQ